MLIDSFFVLFCLWREQGINVHTEDILRDPTQVVLVQEQGLVLFCWGEDNNDSGTIRYLKNIGLNGIIYDKIDEFSSKEIKESIFLVEARESQKELLKLASIPALWEEAALIYNKTTWNIKCILGCKGFVYFFFYSYHYCIDGLTIRAWQHQNSVLVNFFFPLLIIMIILIIIIIIKSVSNWNIVCIIYIFGCFGKGTRRKRRQTRTEREWRRNAITSALNRHWVG